MSRRIVPGTFWVGILLNVVLLLADRVWASKPSDRVSNLVGAWDGFFQEADSGALGLVRSDITGQVHRRIVGDGVLLDLEGRVLTPYDLSATVAGDDFITGSGKTPTGRVVYQAGLETFAGVAGDAGVQHAQYHFVPVRGRAKGVGATLLHPFPDADAPDISGMGAGTFKSQFDPNFAGKLFVEILPLDRGSFPGHVDFIPESVGQPSLSWRLRATTSGADRFVMIAQGKTGKLVADGVALPPQGGDGTSIFIGGFYRLLLLDGRTDFGAYNFNVGNRFAISGP
jgi:hypothetical protein